MTHLLRSDTSAKADEDLHVLVLFCLSELESGDQDAMLPELVTDRKRLVFPFSVK
jgi:hypothetical protein